MKQAFSFLVVALGAALAGALIFQGKSSVPAQVAATPAPSTTPAMVVGVPVTPGVVVLESGDPVVGEPTAPHTVFLFTQWHCSFCRHFFEATFPQIKENLIDTGQLRLVFKVFPLSDEQSDEAQEQRLTQAAYCADQQGKFWNYARHLFAVGAPREPEDLERYAEQEGLVHDTFMVCLQSTEYAEVVAHTIRSAVAIGITATPAFVINDTLYEGALSYAEFVSLLPSP